MKRLLVLLLGTAFCLSLCSPVLYAAQWDPKYPPVYPERTTLIVRPTADDGGWQNIERSPGHVVIWEMFRLWVFQWLHVPDAPVTEHQPTQPPAVIEEGVNDHGSGPAGAH